MFFLIFIGLAKSKKKPSKDSFEQASKMIKELKNKGIKIMGWYMTLGRYDTVLIYEAEDEKEALKVSLSEADLISSETLVAVPREDIAQFL